MEVKGGCVQARERECRSWKRRTGEKKGQARFDILKGKVCGQNIGKR